MGLDTSHDCWHGPYSTFKQWREAVARAVGIELPQMKGFGGEGRWDMLAPDPIHVLLNHSDCDGEIKAADCLPLAERLEQVIPSLPDGDYPFDEHAWRGKAKQFADGLRLAASRGEDVIFS